MIPRSSIAITLGLALALTTSTAIAKSSLITKYSSPQRYAAEIKLGPYTPDLAASANGDPFGDIMRTTGIMVLGEFDWQIWQGFGSIGVGISGGYYSNSDQPLKDNGNDTTPSPANGERLAGETSITLLPLSLLAVYRFDVPAKRFDVPLVPYVKLGFNYTFWWISKGDGETASFDGQEAEGGSWGLQFNVGVALLLDVFEPQSAKTLDSDLGVNHSYLFVELHYSGADRFGAESALTVGDTTFFAGLAFEM